MKKNSPVQPIPDPSPVSQDLHIHSVFSHLDSAVVPEQTLDLIAAVQHVRVVGISDHFDNLAAGRTIEAYIEAAQARGFRLGTEVCSARWIPEAVEYPFEYFVFHCEDRRQEYEGAERLLETGKPVIIAHPLILGTNLDKIPPECLVEINNRYVWRSNWRAGLQPYAGRFRFVLNSDAHQPNWLNLNVARYVARELGIRETAVF